MTVSGFTCAPGSRRIRSTWPSVPAESQRTSSGTRVPKPATRQIMGPDSTVASCREVLSTVGEAERSRRTPKEMAMQVPKTSTANIQRETGRDRRRFTKSSMKYVHEYYKRPGGGPKGKKAARRNK